MADFSSILVVFCSVVCCASLARPDMSNHHRYKAGDPVPLHVSKVGSYNSPSETYAYFDLPFCSPGQADEKNKSFREVLNGDSLVSAPYKLHFLEDKTSEVACKKKLNKEEISQFQKAIARDYYVEMFCDDLQVWSFVGQEESFGVTGPDVHKYTLYTHIEFEISYNKDHVIGVDLRTSLGSKRVELSDNEVVEVEFSYAVKWREANITFDKRMEAYEYSLASVTPDELEIHWFSVMNSCVTVLCLLACMVTFYVRVIRKASISEKYMYANDVELADQMEETGWKVIHADVFRYPNHKCLFAAAVGSGTQLLIITSSIIMLGVVGMFRSYNQGSSRAALVTIYAITSVFAGYSTVSIYRQFEGTNWVKSLVLTGIIFFGPLSLTFCVLNTIAISYKSTASLPRGTIFLLFSIWILVVFPLLVLGGMVARNESVFEAPCRPAKVRREIPTQRWYMGTLPRMAIAGLLPFGVIFVELHYLFGNLWSLRVYAVYPIFLIVFCILLIVTAFVSVAVTYFQLAAEDHEWWWRSFLSGGSTGLFIYGYCLYYYYATANMSGILQTSFFFGYMACLSFGCFLMLGTIGFRASLLFVRHIYGSSKCE